MIDLFELYLAEDCPYGDETTELLGIEGKGRLRIMTREHGVAACMDDLGKLYESRGLEVVSSFRNGEEFNPNDVIFEAQGDLPMLFKLWRFSQTFLSMVCAIASMTRYTVELARKVNPEVMIATTRKTHPGFRKYELKAVTIGGGAHHRTSLSDSVQITQNHFNVIEELGQLRSMRKIEIEPNTVEDAYKYAAMADIIMLDHKSPGEMKTIVPKLRELNPKLRIAIGGIDIEKVSEYAALVDTIITTAPYYASPLDMSTKIRKL
ncbi:nicotinate-nucleotide pyrophosphorylase [Methanolobus sp. ZRKC3]|uniref:nicotinate-nucleotide pyrophosphorylase n=1 Tax=Methanolobus sp. ZRKC3 TaxID=3125786 RepID=UPI0032446424